MSADPDALIKAMQKMIDESKTDEVSNPFTQEPKAGNVIRPATDDMKFKDLKGIETGTFLDRMFLDGEDKPINGIPFGSNSILTGLPNSGKSLLLEEIALRLAAQEDGVEPRHKVCYVLSEEMWRTEGARFDLENRMRNKARQLNLDWSIISKNLYVLDTVTHAELRDWFNFISTLRNLVETEKIDILLIDSMTLLEDNRGSLKFRVLELIRYCQTHGLTSILINQRAVEESDSLAMAGGIALSHIVDTVFILDYKKISSWDSQLKTDIPTAKQGQVLNFFRILKCRICRSDGHYFGYEITKDGLVKLIEAEGLKEGNAITKGSE